MANDDTNTNGNTSNVTAANAEEKVATLSEDGLTVQMSDPREQPTEEPSVVPKQEEKLAGFKSVEELERAYKELSDKLKGQSEEKPEEDKAKDETKNEDVKLPESREDAEKLLEQKGNLDIKSFENEYVSNGSLSEDSYAKLEKAGITRSMVDQYIQSSKIISDNMVKTLKDSVGGEETYAQMTEWAKENLSQQELKDYNDIMFSGNIKLIKMAVQNLHMRHVEAVGKRPSVNVSGKASAYGGSHEQGFRSSAEMVSAMRDPRYGKDPAYTREIERRVGMSNF